MPLNAHTRSPQHFLIKANVHIPTVTVWGFLRHDRTFKNINYSVLFVKCQAIFTRENMRKTVDHFERKNLYSSYTNGYVFTFVPGNACLWAYVFFSDYSVTCKDELCLTETGKLNYKLRCHSSPQVWRHEGCSKH